MNARLISVIAAAMLAAVGAGCGGDDGGEDARLTQEEFIEQANAACGRERADLEKEVAEFRQRREEALSPRELNADIAHYVLFPTIEDELEAIRALRVPLEEEKTIDQLLYSEELVTSKLVGARKMGSREALARKFTESGEMLREYGLDACANDTLARQAVNKPN